MGPIYRLAMGEPLFGRRCGSFRVDLWDDPIQWIQSVDRYQLRLLLYDGLVTVNSNKYQFQRGTVLFIQPNSRVALEHFQADPTMDEILWEFTPSANTSVEVAVPLLSPLGDNTLFFERACRRALDRSAPGFQNFHAVMQHLAWHISLPLIEGAKDTLTTDVEAYIRANIHRKLEIKALADRFGVAQNTLIRGFRRTHGMPPQQFVRSLRLQMAYQAIVQTELPIKQVAASVGISDLQHFNHMIQDAYGYSPTRLRYSRTLTNLTKSESVVEVAPVPTDPEDHSPTAS